MEYIFVFDEENKGWWLKIDSLEQLADYYEQTGSGQYDEAVTMYLRQGHPREILHGLSPKERIETMQDMNFKRLQAAVMCAEKMNGTIIDGFRSLNMEVGMNRMRIIEEHGAVYINCVGGHTFAVEYTQFCRRKNPVFPHFSADDIRIKKFEYGSHYYAYIGDMQVRNGDKFKWNTYQAAYNKALSLIG